MAINRAPTYVYGMEINSRFISKFREKEGIICFCAILFAFNYYARESEENAWDSIILKGFKNRNGNTRWMIFHFQMIQRRMVKGSHENELFYWTRSVQGPNIKFDEFETINEEIFNINLNYVRISCIFHHWFAANAIQFIYIFFELQIRKKKFFESIRTHVWGLKSVNCNWLLDLLTSYTFFFSSFASHISIFFGFFFFFSFPFTFTSHHRFLFPK